MTFGLILRLLMFFVVFGVGVYLIHRARKSIDR